MPTQVFILILLCFAIRAKAQDKTSEASHPKVLATGRQYFIRGNAKDGKEYFLKIIAELHTAGNKNAELIVWEELSNLISTRDTVGITRINCLEKMVFLYQQMHNSEKEIEALKSIADIHMNLGRLDTAEAQLLQVLKRYKAINYQYLHYTYDLLAVTNRYRGDFNKAIFYALKAVESMEATKDSYAAAAILFYSRLANMYRELDQPQNSVKWYWKVFTDRTYTGPVNLYMFRDAGFLVRELIKLNQGKDALAFILDIARKNKPIGIYAITSLTTTLAFCYRAMSMDKLSEKYYLDVIALTGKLENDNEVTADANYEAGQYFFDRHQYEQASFHLQKALGVSAGVNSPSTIKDIHLKLYKTDSAKGDYMSAINHLRKYGAINDSIFNQAKSRQIEELKIQYETAQNEKDIKLLNNQNQLQQIAVIEARKTRNITLGGTALLLIMVGLLYNSYRQKQRTNEKLKVQQLEIGEQNISLRHLVNEKEWLVKEIHHRVKNNLQTVMGLLGTQSGYLKNEVAINAITDSQRRIQAMSLIHQKLYQTENLSAINMPDYIHELVDYLSESFDIGKDIRFDLQIERIKLDLSHCIPLGLILNEAITNSFKYAFPHTKKGIISISFRRLPSNELLLIIRDNGIGLPGSFNTKKPDSMGMSLMRGLSREIGATCTIQTRNGTQIELGFVYDPEVTVGVSPLHNQPASPSDTTKTG